jgi:hypothetical protein
MLETAPIASIRKGAAIINRMRREEGGINPATYRNCVEREGESIQQYIEDKTAEAIAEQGFFVDSDNNVVWRDSGENVTREDMESNPMHVDDAIVHEAARKLNLQEGTYTPSDYELSAVNISSDEVGVKRQTETRPKEEGKTQPKKVENAVIHVEMPNNSKDSKATSSSSYTLNSSTVAGAFKILLGFLCINQLLDKTFVFFADGARNLNATIASMFGFKNVKIILDWYHLRKKMEETLSRICNNTIYRNEMLQKAMPLLWRGDVDGAKAILQAMDKNMVKNETQLIYLIGYLERVRATIPNYMLRAELGLRNSSNRGEKANDLIVSNRQKHNGMSWSDIGSSSLASVSATLHNNEIDNWITCGTLSFRLVERITPKRPKRNRRRTDVAYSYAKVKSNKHRVAA